MPDQPDTIEQRITRALTLYLTGHTSSAQAIESATKAAREWHAERTQALREALEALLPMVVDGADAQSMVRAINAASAALAASEADRG